MVSSPSPWACPVGEHGRCHGGTAATACPKLGVLLIQGLGFPVDLDGLLFGDPLWREPPPCAVSWRRRASTCHLVP